ncbi:IS200/IS605 family transposase ISMma22 [subsurface metagenome]
MYPTKKQKQALQSSLDACRWTYNKTLTIRKNAWEEKQESLSLYDTSNFLVRWKEDKPDLKNAFSQCLQNAQLRVDLAFKAFFRRVKAGEKPGYPRFKGFDRYDSFTFPQSGFKLIEERLNISKIGFIKVKLHRPIEGTIKTCTIRRQAGKWYACFPTEYESKSLKENNKAVGIDVGLENFATFSTKEKIKNPRFFNTDQKALTKAQRKLSKQKNGSPERKKAKKVVVRIHERISNRRHNFIHQESRKIVNHFGVICIEKLNVKSMLKNHFLAKSIADVAWNQFAQGLMHKAEEAGRKFVAIDPRGTSQICSQCGTIVKKTLATRWHKCPVCNIRLHRDFNASLNILRLGLESLGIQSVEAPDFSRGE